MKEVLQNIVNNWYQCWKTSEYRFDEDGDEMCFGHYLQDKLPEVNCSYNIQTDEWIVISYNL